MKHLPTILQVRRNSGPTVSGSFIDAGWVWHYVASGSWEFHMGGRAWRVQAGDSVLIPPRLLHVVRPLSDGELLHEVILFSLPEMYSPGNPPCVLTLPTHERKRVRRWFREIEHLQGNGSRASGGSDATSPELARMLEAAGLLTAILGVHLRHETRARESEPAAATGWPEVERAVRYMQQHHTRAGLSLVEISRAAGVTPNYLCRIFMRNMGCSVMDHLAEHRLEQTEVLLLTTALNCSQIAEAAGFSGLHVFSHVFRRRRGMSPTAFRAQHAPRLDG
ncbi:DNA-binding domain-containing protein, AraC-type [Opitutaceae bacterium TAV1]|nr:DNA-binding domain-containing protein, AraC-type [Opitutaceae bacterium TAV1]